jgi:hypothetical protein
VPELTPDALQKALLEADAEFLKTETRFVFAKLFAIRSSKLSDLTFG